MPDLYVARRSMEYGPMSEQYDRGQLLELVGMVNDEKLVRLGYVSAASKGIAVVQCKYCGAKFTTDESLVSHGRDRHANVSAMSPEERDLLEEKVTEARIKKEDAIAPLDLTKTKASRAESTSLEVTTKKSKGRINKSAASRGARTHIG
jgi:transcription elongation factor Elf1